MIGRSVRGVSGGARTYRQAGVAALALAARLALRALHTKARVNTAPAHPRTTTVRVLATIATRTKRRRAEGGVIHKRAGRRGATLTFMPSSPGGPCNKPRVSGGRGARGSRPEGEQKDHVHGMQIFIFLKIICKQQYSYALVTYGTNDNFRFS